MYDTLIVLGWIGVVACIPAASSEFKNTHISQGFNLLFYLFLIIQKNQMLMFGV